MSDSLPKTRNTFLESVEKMVDHAFEHIGMELTPGLEGHIKASHTVLQVQFPVELSDGKIHVFKGWRAVHNPC